MSSSLDKVTFNQENIKNLTKEKVFSLLKKKGFLEKDDNDPLLTEKIRLNDE